jgi:hypothetical protein
LGDVIEAAPVCHALWLLGHDVDFFVDHERPGEVAPLFEGLAPYGRVLRKGDDVDVSPYEFAVACFGPAEVARRMAPGFAAVVTIRDVWREGLLPGNLSVARALGWEGDSPGAPLRCDDAGEPPSRDAVVVHAGSDARATYKRWPHWETVCDRLRAAGARVVVVGTPGDRSTTGWEGRFDARFGLPLPRLAALLRDARAYLGTDSGVTHLAGAVGVPGLVLFGPTDPVRYAPDSTALRVLDAAPRAGEGRAPVDSSFPSIERHDVEGVWREVRRLLDDPPARPAPPSLPPRAGVPSGDAAATLPAAEDVRAAPATLDGMDAVLRRIAVAAIRGALARRGDPREARAWRREVARVAGLAHLRAAAVRRAARTHVSHRRERGHLRLAARAGYRVRAGIARLRHGLTPESRLRDEPDPLRY